MKWSTTDSLQATSEILYELQKQLRSHDSLLVLVSGGSAIETEAKVLNSLDTNHAHVAVLPIDERYGKYGHADSNIAKLKLLVTNPSVQIYDVLESNSPFDETVHAYSALTTTLFAESGGVVGIFGIGEDGHTAGILPNSPATTDTTSTVIGYRWSDYERMTLGIDMLCKIDKAFVLAYGKNKENALSRLQANNEPIEMLPAKLLHDIQDATIYNHYINSKG